MTELLDETPIPTESTNDLVEFLPMELPEKPVGNNDWMKRSNWNRAVRSLMVRTRWNAGDIGDINITDVDGHNAFVWENTGRPVPVSLFDNARMKPRESTGVTIVSQQRAVRRYNDLNTVS